MMKIPSSLLTLAWILFGTATFSYGSIPDDRRALDEFLATRAELIEARHELEANTANLPDEERMAAVREWREAERHRFERMRELATEIAEERPAPAPLERERELPEGLSREMRELLELRWQLRDERFALERDLAGLSDAERMEAFRSWRDSRAETFERMRELSQTVAAARQPPESALIGEPPEGLAPDMREFLTLRHKLIAERHALNVQYGDAPAEERLAAFRQWREHRADAFNELRRLAKAACGDTE